MGLAHQPRMRTAIPLLMKYTFVCLHDASTESEATMARIFKICWFTDNHELMVVADDFASYDEAKEWADENLSDEPYVIKKHDVRCGLH